MTASEHDEQEETWEEMYREIARLLQRFGTENAFGYADYLIVDDNYGFRENHIEIHKLHMLHPDVIARLRRLLTPELRWQISVAVHVPGTKPGWPVMGLYIRAHEIIDGLRREYFPEPYRSYQYDGSRPGTEDD
jgi:hypothetical protein